jgi:hypothetical protein
MKMRSLYFCLLSVYLLGTTLQAADFFSIEKIDFLKKPPRKGLALYREVPVLDKNGAPTKEIEKVFQPTLCVEVQTAEQSRSNSLFARAYFYDKDNKLLETVKGPSPAGDKMAMPLFFKKQERVELLFMVPEKVLKLEEKSWSVVVVFGDKKGAAAKNWPGSGFTGQFDFPEKALVENKEDVERKAAIDPVVEQVVKTGNPRYEQITLLMRPPNGITQGSDVKGVMAMSILANNPGEIREFLQGRNAGWKMGYALDFADRNKLAIIAWGSRRLWDPTKNWDEQSRERNKEMDETFDDVAKAWSRGVEIFVRKYGIPDRDYLLWGMSGSAQFSCRLALRKPEYFLAIHAHIPSSFDQPTPEAARVLWCLTTGELEAGYARSLRFYQQCRGMGYPIVYKAIMGLGHSGSAVADNLGLRFYEYALSLRDQRDAYEASRRDVFGQPLPAKPEDGPPQPWPESFRYPLFVGDAVNQEMFPLEKIDMVPAGFRVPLPNKELAEAWNKK